MNTRRIKPAPGLKIRKPNGQHLADTGETVRISSYWLRRLKEGSCVEVTGKANKTKTTRKETQ